LGTRKTNRNIAAKIDSMKVCSEIFLEYNLLNHPFYLAWSEGRLTCSQLSLYARQYGSFIKLITEGWRSVNEEAIATEEQEHYELWQKFGNSLNKEVTNAFFPAVHELVTTTKENYRTYAGALGALYAFEAQQPATATSKLQGLKEHYRKWNVDETYFTIHANDVEEPALLEEKMNALSSADRSIAYDACATTCRLLYNALTDIYNYTEVALQNRM
jgi:pyrroloquinoline-quinone synthase